MANGIELRLTDAAALTSTQTFTETALLGVGDPTPNLVILTQLNVTDSHVLSAADAARSPVFSLTATDSCAVQSTETVSPVIATGIALHFTDQASIAVVQAVTDSTRLDATEAATIPMAFVATDTLLLNTTDATPTEAVVILGADSVLLAGADPTPTLNTGAASTDAKSASDSTRLGLDDGDTAPDFLTVNATDTCVIEVSLVGFGEDVGIYGYTPTDFKFKSVADSCKVQVLTPPVNQLAISASDSCVLTLTEPQAASGELVVGDSPAPHAAETVSAIDVAATAFLTVTDTIVLPAGETVMPVPTVWEVALSVTDSVTLPTSETAVATQDIAFYATSDSMLLATTDTAQSITRTHAVTDSAAIHAVEPLAASGELVPSDSLKVGATDGAPAIAGSFSFNVNDSLLVSGTDATPTFPVSQAVSAVESLRTQATEGGQLISAAAACADTLTIPLSDASLLLWKFLALTDALAIPTSDAATLFNDFIAVVASDSTAVLGDDLATSVLQTLTQLSTTDDAQLALAEALVIANSQTTDDAVLVAAGELLTALKTLLVSDDAAYAIASEDANVLNPFVIVSYIFVDDSASVTVTDATGALPELIGLYSNDDSTVMSTEATLTEPIAPPDYWDGNIGASYDTMQPDPVSYRMSPSNTW